MKSIRYSIILAIGIALSSCHDLDLNPLSQGSTSNWYSNETEVEMAVNTFYREVFWGQDGEGNTDWSDDMTYRQAPTSFELGTITGQSGDVTSLWSYQYKLIARANSVIEKAHRAIENGYNEININRLIGEARFFRAVAYSKLVFKFGDVPMILSDMDIDEGFTHGRDSKEQVLTQIYADFDNAISVLPVKSSGQQRVTKGAALAYKTRIALFMYDYATAAQAAKECIDLGVYRLHDNYEQLFLPGTRQSSEFIFTIPRSVENDIYISTYITQNYLVRNRGGYAATVPSWDMLAAYTCTDGLPIDESPLFDPHNPFKNRDPRCLMSIVEPGSTFLGVEYDPSPYAKEVMNYTTGKMIKNNDSKVNATYASFNGLVWKKGIDETWTQNGYKAEPDRILMRYADLLLMYAEAKIELGQIDQSVLDAMNAVRARAYGVDPGATESYPAFTNSGKEKLRQQLRVERRMELACEHRRFADIMRWRIAGRCLKKNYGFPMDIKDMQAFYDAGDWFWPMTPDIDEEGIPDFTAMEATGKIFVLSERNWNDRQYLWPIPTSEIQINSNMTQNPGY